MIPFLTACLTVGEFFMRGNLYISYSELFGQKPPLSSLKMALRQFKLSDALFHVSRMNVLLGRNRMLGEGREAMQELQGQLVANYIDDEILEGKLKPIFGPFKRDERAVFVRQAALGLLRLIALVCEESAATIAVGKTPGGYQLGRSCLMMNDHLLSRREEKAISEGSSSKRKRHLGMQLAPLLELYNPPRLNRAVVRAEIMFSELLNSDEMRVIAKSKLGGFDLNSAFLNATGLTIEKYKELVLGTISWLYGNETNDFVNNPNLLTFRRSQFINDSLIKPKDFDNYLSLDSLTPAQLKKRFTERRVKVLPHFDYVVFRTRPLIEVDKDAFICADACFLVEKLSSGIYWTIVDSLSGSDKQRAFDAFGYLLESYLNRLFQQIPISDGCFLSDLKYTNGDSAFDGAIWHGNHLIVMEYKASFMRAEAKYGGKIRLFEQELDKKFGLDKNTRKQKGVAQLANHIGHLFCKEPSERRTISELTDVIQQSSCRIERITPVLIVQEPALRLQILEDILSQKFRNLLKGKSISNAVRVEPPVKGNAHRHKANRAIAVSAQLASQVWRRR
jgi:hypothetical protein